MTDVAESHKGLSWLCCFMSAWVAEPTVLTWSALGVPVVLGRGCFFPCMKGLSEFGLSVGPAIALEKPRLGTSLGLQWLGLHAPKAGGLGSIPGQETGSCKMQLSVWMPGAAKYINIKKKKKKQQQPRLPLSVGCSLSYHGKGMGKTPLLHNPLLRQMHRGRTSYHCYLGWLKLQQSPVVQSVMVKKYSKWHTKLEDKGSGELREETEPLSNVRSS